MSIRTIHFISLITTVLAFGAGLAHLLELPNKIHLPAEHYLTVQQIYRGWALLGFVVFSALISTAIFTVMVRNEPRVFRLALVALVCIAATLIVFFTFTYPANQQTNNWTFLPDNWLELRKRWEYSHATSAGLYFIAVSALFWSALIRVDADQ